MSEWQIPQYRISISTSCGPGSRRSKLNGSRVDVGPLVAYPRIGLNSFRQPFRVWHSTNEGEDRTGLNHARFAGAVVPNFDSFEMPVTRHPGDLSVGQELDVLRLLDAPPKIPRHVLPPIVAT